MTMKPRGNGRRSSLDCLLGLQLTSKQCIISKRGTSERRMLYLAVPLTTLPTHLLPSSLFCRTIRHCTIQPSPAPRAYPNASTHAPDYSRHRERFLPSTSSPAWVSTPRETSPHWLSKTKTAQSAISARVGSLSPPCPCASARSARRKLFRSSGTRCESFRALRKEKTRAWSWSGRGGSSRHARRSRPSSAPTTRRSTPGCAGARFWTSAWSCAVASRESCPPPPPGRRLLTSK